MLIRPEDCWAAPTARTAGTPEPDFRFEEFFAGPALGWGVFRDRFGTVRKRFTVETRGGWEDDIFRLEERFAYSDGTTDERVWSVTMPAPGHYRAEAHDIVGHAEGEAAHGGVRFRYAMRVPVGQFAFVFDFDDWMVPHANGVLNLSRASKLGVRIGELTAFFWRRGVELASR